jgi:hypothetical protein
VHIEVKPTRGSTLALMWMRNYARVQKRQTHGRTSCGRDTGCVQERRVMP